MKTTYKGPAVSALDKSSPSTSKVVPPRARRALKTLSSSFERDVGRSRSPSFYDSNSASSASEDKCPPDLLAPDSDVADNNPPSPSENFKAYSRLVLRVAKALELNIEQPPL